MSRFCALAFVLLSLVGCGPTQAQACDSAGKALCAKMWGCTGVQGLKFGSDEASCQTSYRTLCSIGTVDIDKGLKCASDVTAQSCDQFKMGQPASCSSN
jgi:hypothetical protein